MTEVTENGTKLTLPMVLPVRSGGAGLLVSRGHGRHPDRVWPSFDLIFVREGELGIQEEDRPYRVRAGEALLLWPERRHFGTADYPGDLKFYWTQFTLSALGRSDSLLTVAQHSILARPDRMTELFRRYLDDQEADALTPQAADLLTLLMLQEMASQTPRPASVSALAARADALLRARFHEPFHAGKIAAELGCHPNYLSRVYREAYGRTPTEALHRRRLDHARRLLIESLRNVDEIARDCGFEDAGYFRRLFKRETGLTPTAFRRLYARVFVNTE